jgi:hypothetical protein
MFYQIDLIRVQGELRHRDTEIPPILSDSGPFKTMRMKATGSNDQLASTASSTGQNGTWVAIGENCSCLSLSPSLPQLFSTDGFSVSH